MAGARNRRGGAAIAGSGLGDASGESKTARELAL